MDTPDVEVGKYGTKPHSEVAFRTYRHLILHIAVKLECCFHISLNYFLPKNTQARANHGMMVIN